MKNKIKNEEQKTHRVVSNENHIIYSVKPMETINTARNISSIM